MNTLHFYVNDHLTADGLTLVKADLMAMSHVHNVEFGLGSPREVLVEVDENCNMTMSVSDVLSKVGLNPEISYS